MKPDHLKLASIVTLVCGAMSSMAAGATNADSLTMSAGRIIPMRSMTPDPAPNGIDDDAQDGTAVSPGDAPAVAQTKDANDGAAVVESGPVAQQGAAPGIAYAASTLLWSGQDTGHPASTVPDSAHVPTVTMTPVTALAPVEPVQDAAPVASAGDDSSRVPDAAPATSAADDSAHGSDTPVVSARDDVPLANPNNTNVQAEPARVSDVPVVATPPVAREISVAEETTRAQDVASTPAPQVAPSTNAVPDSTQTSSNAPPSSAVSDSGDAPVASAVSARNEAPTVDDLAGSARELSLPSLAKQDVAPAIDAAQRAAQAPDATAVSSRDMTPTASSAPDVAHVAEAHPAFAAQALPAATPVAPAVASVRISTPVMPTSDVAPEPEP
ncbi:MAG TPA: hypothetical protein VEI25_11620 [Paraburkholderia sp.]|nr:hypothetical protein [Paraburkholderia sp.]